MKNSRANRILCFGMVFLFILACRQKDREVPNSNEANPKFFTVTVQHTLDSERRDCPVFLDIRKLVETYPGLNRNAFVVTSGEREIPSQADDLDGDARKDQIVFVTDFHPQEKKEIIITFSPWLRIKKAYTKRTQAELSHKVGGAFAGGEYQGGRFRNVTSVRVPAEHTDHSTYFRYEGPGWESDRVGYRFYLDWRNAIDIFGKKTQKMVLWNVGLDGFDSYHEMADWGMDIFKVGESMGIGSIGMWHGDRVYMVSQTDSVFCRIVADGPVHSLIETRYFGWTVDSDEYDLTSQLSITAGNRMTKHSIEITGQPPNVCTGLAKHEDCDIVRSDNGKDRGWRYVGLYGRQSLAGDHLGTAILYRTGDFMGLVEDELSHIILLKPESGVVTYYFVAAWEQEVDGIRNRNEFQQYLDRTVSELNHPIEVTLHE